MASFSDQPLQNIPTQQHGEDNLRKLRKEIFEKAMKHDWKTVHSLYEEHKEVRHEKITRADDTVLHVAISGAKQETTIKLLKVIEVENNEEERGKILLAQNKRGDTPLHLAAALGLENVCHKIAQLGGEMVTSARNDLQETPLVTAVRYGKRDAFFVLEAAIPDSARETAIEGDTSLWLSNCRGYEGNNILHYAIKGEQFDLAYEIIHLYPGLVNYFNTRGETALHTLANKPSVFESGTRLGLYDRIIYYCTITEPLKLKFCDFKNNIEAGNLPLDIDKGEKEIVPPTYRTCIDLFSSMKDIIHCIYKTVDSSLRTGICKRCCSDEENQYLGKSDQKQRQFPLNYEVAVSFFKIIVKLLLIVFGIGFRRLNTIAKHKQKHRNAVIIMNKLVDESKLWEYEDANGGMKPADSTLQQELSDQSTLSPVLSDIGSEGPPSVTSVETTGPSLEGNQPNQSKGSNIMIAANEGGRAMLKKVLENFSLEVKNADKKDVIIVGMEEKESTNRPDTATPVLVAAKRGIKEMVKKILDNFPVAILDHDEDEKNIVLLAVEHRQVHVYNYMLRVPTMKEHVFGKVDKEGNSALHHAAMLSHSRPWNIPGAALQMQWESKWYKYVLGSMNQEIFATINNEGRTAREIFIESHDTLVKDGSTWLTNTSQSCSVVAALVATVAFASATTVPGGVDQVSGFPILIKRPAFQLFAIASLVALCFSVTSLVMFLAILTSRYQVRDFERGLPMKLILGLTSLFMSIASMLLSFCAGDFFVVEKRLKFAAYPIYAVMCFPVTFFAVAQFPLYIDLIKATIKKVPERTEKMQDY